MLKEAECKDYVYFINVKYIKEFYTEILSTP